MAAVAAWDQSRGGIVSGSWDAQLLDLARGLTYYILSGLVAAGLLLACGCAVTRRPYYPVTAGHWLLTANGLILIVSEASNLIARLANSGIHPDEWEYLVRMNAFILMAGVNLVAAFAMRDGWPWRIVFVSYAAIMAFWAVVTTLLVLDRRGIGETWLWYGIDMNWPAQWVVIVAIVFLSAIDLRRGVSRDWLHWAGVGYVAAWVGSQSLLAFMGRWVTR